MYTMCTNTLKPCYFKTFEQIWYIFTFLDLYSMYSSNFSSKYHLIINKPS